MYTNPPPVYAQPQPMMAQPASKPTAAFVLSLIGGIFILLGGLAILAIGALFAFLFFGLAIAAIGGAGVVVGILIILGAVLFYMHPESNQTLWGVLIIILSIVSWIVAVGGFFIGFLLALLGGIFILTWKPAPPPQQVVMFTPQQPAPMLRMCPKCGRQVDPNVKFCQHCGNALP